MNKTIIAIVIVAVVALGGYFLFKGSYQPAPAVPQTSNQQPTTQPPISEPSVPEQPVQQPPVSQTPVVKENVVTYTDNGYSPSTLKVKNGGTVIFKNQSSRAMWTASAVHPTHRGYPTTGGCLGSTFDTCTGVQSGGSWSFKFDISGTWKYHNHLNPGDTGTIVVE
ncbi:MAG: hypothetical protein HZC26_03620 [Candidatus Magasanikbacteria bacterium]|nr:hypothetical protein [Candidatus Magasanikbacteria bacterium]